MDLHRFSGSKSIYLISNFTIKQPELKLLIMPLKPIVMKKNKTKDSYMKQAYVTQTKGFVDVSGKMEFWSEMATEFNGDLKISQTVARDLKILNLKIPFDGVVIEFIESDTHPLKVSCELASKKDIRFSLSIEDVFEKIMKVFGQQDIVLNDPVFDKRYLVKGKDENLTKEILNYKSVKQLIMKTNIFSMICDYNKKKQTLKLMSMVGRTVHSKEEMKDILNLITSVVEKLKTEIQA